MYNWAYSMVRAKKMSREEVKIQRDLAKSSGWQIINILYIKANISREKTQGFAKWYICWTSLV